MAKTRQKGPAWEDGNGFFHVEIPAKHCESGRRTHRRIRARTKKEADKIAGRLLIGLEDGTIEKIKPKARAETVGWTWQQLADAFVAAHKHWKPQTVVNAKQRLAVWAQALDPKTQLAKLTFDGVRAARERLDLLPQKSGKPRSASTVALTASVISSVFMWADRTRVRPDLERGLADAMRKLRGDKSAAPRQISASDVFTREDISKMLAHINGAEPMATGLAISLAALHGPRRGEVLGAKWADVDFTKLEWLVRRSMGNDSTKTGRSRTVPLSEDFVKRLREYRMKSSYKGDDDFIFPSADGKLASDGWLLGALRRAAKACGIKRPRIHLNLLRHSFITNAILEGRDLYWIARYVGHRTNRMIQLVYAHCDADSLRDEPKTARQKTLSEAL